LLLEALREKAFLKRSRARPKLFRLAVRCVADSSCRTWDDMAGQSLIADGWVPVWRDYGIREHKTGEEVVAVVERIPGNR
jgi:hypothetical protein